MKKSFNKNRVKRTVNEDGDVFWRNAAGQCHRKEEDGPAVKYKDGTKEWWFEGKRDRTGGAAVEHADGAKEFWLKGERLSPDEFALRQGTATPVAARRPIQLRLKPVN